MKSPSILERLAVCSWSLQPTSPEDLCQKLRATGIRRVQLALDPLRASPKIWGDSEAAFREHGITVVSGMVSCIGEDYSTLDSIRLTGGIAPDATWDQNIKNIADCASIAKKMGLKLVTFHAGFLPPDESHPTFTKMLQRLDIVADIFMVQNILLGLETGQETAAELAALLHKLNHPNIGVNFDPANMIMYDKGDPVKALHVLAPWIRQVHIKDAQRTKIPGTWGPEVPVGTGEVNWRAFFSTFKHVVFNVNLAIEREYGNNRIADIRTARELMERTFFLKPSMAAKKVNVAVAGLGFMGVTHLGAYQKIRGARIVGVCDASRAPVNGVLRGVNGNIQNSADIRLGPGVKVYRDFDELAADPDVDLVDICTPTAMHCAHAITALKAGKHTLCEKPLAQNVSEARKILQAAQATDKFLMPAMCMRFWPGWSWLKKTVGEQTYGAVRAASLRRVSARPAWGKAGSHAGGALLDLHIHDTDFVNFLFGRPASIFSTGMVDVSGTVNHVLTDYFYPQGPAVHAEGSWLLPDGFNMSFTVHSERAMIDFDLSRGAEALRLHETEKKPRSIKLKNTDGYNEEIAYFVNCVARGVKPSVVTAQDGLTALEICAAEEKSVRTGAVVKLRAAL